MKVQRTTSIRNTKLTALIYALTGTGKTRLCGTAQDCAATSPTLLIDVGGGTTTLAGKKIDLVRPHSLSEFQEIYDYLRNDNDKYRSVCLDGLTGVQQELSMPEIQGLREPGEEDTYSNLAEAEPPDRRHWLKSHEHTRRILRAFRDLAIHPQPKFRIHVIMTALEKKDDNRAIICPQLPGVLGLECGAYVDILARLQLEEHEKDEKKVLVRRLIVHQRENDEGLVILAKNRGDKLGKQVFRPTIDKIMSLWTSENK